MGKYVILMYYANDRCGIGADHGIPHRKKENGGDSNMKYEQLLLSELRVVPVRYGSAEPDDAMLAKAVTANEELINLGYTLSPKDMIPLSVTPDLDGFVSRVREYIGDVKADPMYPDFPSQVMEMDEAVFRFHQMLHYLSTYGVTLFTGTKVKRGWLPEVQKTEKIKSDDKLLEAKVIELIGENEKYITPYKKIMTRTERMDDKQRMIVKECAENLTPEQIASVTVTFKQNLLDVFNAVFTSEKLGREAKLVLLHTICQHTGDVYKCVDYSLTRARFHLKTSQKRLLVKLLESFPIEDFKANLILSNKKGKRTELMLRFLDFNTYSRKEEYKQAVAELRSGKLRSWESRAKFLAVHKNPEALSFFGARPGMMLRAMTYLLRNGYRSEDIFNTLLPNAASLKTQSLVSLMSFFNRPGLNDLDDARFKEAVIISRMVNSLLEKRLEANKTKLAGKFVCINMPQFDLDLSTIRINNRSNEGGYIRPGLAYKIPEGVNRLRFFVYWNDKERVDIDLHGAARRLDGSYDHIGWNAGFKSDTLVFSGDITHSDAAEYIDIDLEKAGKLVDTVGVNINIYYGRPTFKEIGECFVGAMAVGTMNKEIKLYDPKNCFFTHFLTSKCRQMNYGYVDIQNRAIIFDGNESGRGYYNVMPRDNGFSLRSYLDILLRSQRAVMVDDPEKADITLVMGKPTTPKEISLIDNNFFMEA